MSDSIDLSEKLATFSEHWSPRTVAQFNDCDVMVVKVQGEFVWHKHDDTDDFFLVLKGVLELQLRESKRSPSVPGKCMWCRRASSIAPSRARRCICC
jgi:mannose-6-phosphate isomerase-like protein (cupin superfamily)